MYCDFYRMTERPFNVTPDPKFLYLNARYREAIASLHYGITQRRGFITLIGEAGTGKTTLLKRLLDDLDDRTKSVFVFNTNVSFEEILEYIFAEFDLPVHNGKKLYMLQRLNTFLLEELRRGCNVALLIDEAQDLEFSVLEDLRLLSNLETAKEKILQIVLSGQPELGQKLSNPVLRQLRQRISINCRLLPLSRDEITEYVEFRLQAAGCPDLKLFTREAEDQIYRFSRGVPRLVNVVCDNALVIGYALGKKRIGADVIKEAAADLLSVQEDDGRPIEVAEEPSSRLGAAPSPTSRPGRWRLSPALLGGVLGAVMIGLLSAGRTMLFDSAGPEAQGDAAPPPLEVIRPGSRPRGAGVDIPPAEARPVVREQPAPPAAGAAPHVAARQSAQAPEPDARVALAPRQPPTAPGPDAADVAFERGSDARRLEPAVPDGSSALSGAVPPAAEARPAAAFPEVAAARIDPPVVAPQPAERKAPQEPAEAVERTAEVSAQEVAALTRPNDVRDALWRATGRDEERDTPPAEESVAPVPPEAFQLDGVTFAQAIVRPGDSVSAIAVREYGQASPTILALLKLANPRVSDIDIIVVGQTLRLPQLGDGFPVLHDGSGEYSLLVSSTYRAPVADRLRDRLRGYGYNARISSGTLGAGKETHRVLVSGFRSREDVGEAGMRLQRLFREETAMAELAR